MTQVNETTGADVTEGGRRTPWLLIGGGVGAAVVIGGGAAAAMMMGGGGDQPTSVLPGSAAAYAQVDLDPSAGQKVAAVRFAQGLDPEIRERLDAGEWREWVWEQIEEQGDTPFEVSFEEDIEPWLGDRAGIAVLPAGEGEEPVVAVALQVKDGDAALEFLDRMKSEAAANPEVEGDDVDYYLESDYVVFSAVDTLETVRSAAEAGTLADNETFTSDMDDLGDTGIAAFWADASRLDEFDTAALNPAVAMTEDQLGVEQPEITGRMAATLRLSEDAVEIHGISRGVEGIALAESAGAAPLVADLPADTAVAISLENGAAMVQAAWDYYAGLYPEQVEEARTSAADAGFTLPDDVKTVLGDSMVLSAGPGIVDAAMNIGPTDSSVPALPVGYRVTTDTARLQTLLDENGVGAGVLTLRDDDGTLTLGTDQGYVDALASGEGDTLGSADLFTRAVPDQGDAQTVIYVNVNPFEQYYLPQVTDEQARTALESLGAVGISGTNENANDGHFTVRLVADPAE